ncbi:hypothetical protein ACS0TY_017080 [Phlomoides rotata]
MRLRTRKKAQLILLLKAILERTIVIISFGISILHLTNQKNISNGHPRKYTIIDRIPSQIQNMVDLLHVNDEDYRNKLRMDRTSFYRLCSILQHVGGLKPSKYVNVSEKVAMFLMILAHHSKNHCVKFQFKRSGQTVSKEFHSVLRSILKLHNLLLVKPNSVPDDSNDTRWDLIESLESTTKWAQWRDTLAQSMFNDYNALIIHGK